MIDIKDIVQLTGNVGVPGVILVLLILKASPFLDKFLDQAKSRNGDLRELVLVLKDLVGTLKLRG